MHASPKVLILAGRRPGAPDALATAFGTSHKCLVPVAGVPMIVRVLEACDTAFPDSPLYVSIEDEAVLADEPTVARLRAAGRLTLLPSRAHIVDSIIDAAAVTGFPLLVTTADNVLMTPDAMRRFVRVAETRPVEALAGMARREDILAAHPDGQRRFYAFRDGAFSNCNLFYLKDAKAMQAAETFRHGGQFGKNPARIVKAFGLLNLLRFRTGWYRLDQIFAAVSRRFGVVIGAHVFEAEGRLAIDVDNERTHRVAEEILASDGG